MKIIIPGISFVIGLFAMFILMSFFWSEQEINIDNTFALPENQAQSDFIVINSPVAYYRINKDSSVFIEPYNNGKELMYICYIDSPTGNRKVIEFKDCFINDDYITAEEQKEAFIMEFNL